MRTSVLLMITAVIYGLYGLAFIFIPAQVVGQYGGALGDIGSLMAQLYGSLLVGVALVSWQIKEAERDTAFMAFLLGMCVAIGIATVLVAINQFTSPTAKTWTWSTVVIQALLSFSFGYARFGPPPKLD